jgi:hypothetical protein
MAFLLRAPLPSDATVTCHNSHIPIKKRAILANEILAKAPLPSSTVTCHSVSHNYKPIYFPFLYQSGPAQSATASGQQTVDSRQRAADSGQQTVRSRQWAAGSGQQAVGSMQWAAGSGQQAVGSRQWAADSGQQAVGSRQWAAGSGQQTVDSRQWAAGSAEQKVGSMQVELHHTCNKVRQLITGTIKTENYNVLVSHCPGVQPGKKEL